MSICRKPSSFSQFVVEELDWPALIPDPDPIQHLWGELEHQLQGRPTLELDLTNALVAYRKKSLQPASKISAFTLRGNLLKVL